MGNRNSRTLPTNKPYAFFTATISASNTYASVEIETGIVPSGQYGLRILDISLGDPGGTTVPIRYTGASNNPWLKVQLTKSVQTAILPWSSREQLATLSVGAAAFLTTSGVNDVAFELPLEMEIPTEVIVVTPSIFIGSLTSAASFLGELSARIYYEPVKMSEVEILRILTG